MISWLGVDVGGSRKGFDVALIDARALLVLAGGLGSDAVLDLVAARRPGLVAIDSPRSCAPAGERARDDERRVNRSVCGIRWTPDSASVHASAYYSWIVEGLALFAALSARGVDVVEVFPTASWTRWFGRRGSLSRSAWSRAGLASLGLEDVPARTNQDQRDAIAAAVTARQHTQGLTESFGEIVVPVRRWGE
jgi:predicted nuclease with RNAse H fold